MSEPPTLHEWAAGRPAIARLIDCFHDRVERDDLLSPSFPGGVSAEHREHVTTWWCEVLGGPAGYTERLGGYPAMLAHHRCLGVTAVQRFRFASLMSLAADDAGLQLRARLRALLRRNAASTERLSYGDLMLDLAAARVTRGGREVSLTRTEYLLLELFLRNPGRVLSHSQIFQAVWGYDFGLRSNNLWVYMGYLRTKLEAAGEPRILHTVRGLGYVLRDEP